MTTKPAPVESPPCPKCGKPLSCLRAYSLEENKQHVYLQQGRYEGDEPTLDWSASEVVESTCKSIDFECPSCHATLYQNQGTSTDPNIIALLRGEPLK